VRDTVVWVGREIDAGYGDPGDTMKRSQESDPERNDWSTILSGLRDAFGDEWVKASDIYDVIFKQRSITSGKSMGPRAREDLREAFEGLVANGGEVRSSRSLGQMLNFRIDRLVAGLVLRKRWERTKTSVFRVEMSEERSKDVSATDDVQRSSREAA